MGEVFKMKAPITFVTQREAYWYVEGVKSAKRQTEMILDEEILRYDLEYLDHLPEGDSENKATQIPIFEVSLDVEQKANILNKLYLQAKMLVASGSSLSDLKEDNEQYEKMEEHAQYFLDVLEKEVREQ